MPEINSVVTKTETGVSNIAVASNVSHHSIGIACGVANTFTIKTKLTGSLPAIDFEDNTLERNTSATFVLPGIVAIEITPTDLAAEYSVKVSSF